MNQNLLRKQISDGSEMTDRDLFLCPSMESFFNTFSAGITEKLESSIKITLGWDCNGEIAYANSRNGVYLNCENKFTHDTSRQTRFTYMKGICLHECGHLLWTDFKLWEDRSNKFLQNGVVCPDPDTKESSYIQTTMRKYPALRQPFYRILADLDNCIEDGYIEYGLLQLCGGYSRSLHIVRRMQADSIKSWRKMKDNGLDEIAILINGVLSYAKYQKKILAFSDGSDIQELYFSFLQNVDDAVTMHRATERAMAVNRIFCKIGAWLLNQLENCDSKDNEQAGSNGSSGQEEKVNGTNQESSGEPVSGENEIQSQNESRSNNSKDSKESGKCQAGQPAGKRETETPDDKDSSEKGITIESLSDAVRHIIDALCDVTSDEGEHNIQNNVPVLNESAVCSNPAANENRKIDIECLLKDRFASSDIEKITQQEARRKRDELSERQLLKELQDKLKGIPLSHFQIQLSRADIGDCNEYESMRHRLDPLARRMQVELFRQIEDKRAGDNLRHLYYGPRIDMHSYIQKDGKAFSKRILPEEFPDMCISVLIDQSGSTRGKKIEIERDTAYTVYRFCQLVGIPVSVYGHNGSERHIYLTSFAEFSSIDGKDGQRIASVKASGSNRDGYALRFCASHLYDQNAEIKILFVASDGRPSLYASDAEAMADMHDAIREYSKKGIIFIAAGIAADNEHLRYYYAEGIQNRYAAKFLNLSDFGTMPVQFIKIIKKYIEKEI